MRCAVIGLGEAGRTYAEALVLRGHEVTGFDPVVDSVEGVRIAADAAAAVRGADVVLVLTAARFGGSIAAESRPELGAGAVYADLTSGSPEQMLDIDELISSAGVPFADVAILGPIPLKGAATPVIISGAGAERVGELLASLGAPVEIVEGPGGRAVAHKLLRSVFMKGVAALVCETMEAARAADLEDWTRVQLAGQLSGGERAVDRFLTGTRKHAARRADEMRASREFLRSLEVAHPMTDGTVSLLERYTREVGRDG